jgi:hypothetical protein
MPRLSKTKIKQAWKALLMPRLDSMEVVHEHGQWWVIGWDEDDRSKTYAVVEAVGPRTYNGLAFEEC